MNYPKKFDVIIIGAGHAGCEAAHITAQMGVKTLLITQNIETIGQMSCNPAIGGIGKSQLVREIDALGGIMALVTDQSGIQFRTLNSRKGPAVRSTRAQADKQLYKINIRKILENTPNLWIFQQECFDLIIKNEQIQGITTQTGISFFSKTVILTNGTFLNGLIHIGLKNYTGGRMGDKSSTFLANRLKELNLKINRLKTGTPPRIDANSINCTILDIQSGDNPTPYMSFLENNQHPEQINCWITNTNERTHQIIADNLNRSPIYSGVIESSGPRYCPSIEDKIHRFASKNSHQIFLEPEGLTSKEIYPNGISTSLPFDVQYDLVRSIKGLENAHLTRPGYAIEYDFFDPQDLKYTLETKAIKGLFFAGQINGTTGYEEAAAQGLLAGINAALMCKELEPWYPKRSEAYLGVMIDDLITLGTHEPYRMFTSRAEYRLLLREDNADIRLTEIGRKLGTVDDNRWQHFCHKRELIEQETAKLKNTWILPNTKQANYLQQELNITLNHEYNLISLLSRPELNYKKLRNLISNPIDNKQVIQQIEIQNKYQGYIKRQEEEILKLQEQEDFNLPNNIDYAQINGLSKEIIQKLNDIKPINLAQAKRIPGITPVAISLLIIYFKKHFYYQNHHNE